MRSSIQFAPLRVPLSRRKETAALAIYAAVIPTGLFLGLLFCSIRFCWPIVIAYISYNYFYPTRIRQNLDPTQKYIFGYHPHGIIGMGAVASFATEATGFSQLFPGITPNLLTLTNNFYIPLQRELIISLGIGDVSGPSAKKILLEGGKGTSITIVIGGAEEALNSRPGRNDLILRRRLGFIKLAIRSGAHLVPVFSFGENEIFEQFANEKGTLLHYLQTLCRKLFGFTIPIWYGRGIFNYNAGILPFRKPITSVVGRVVKVVQCDEPTAEMMESIRVAYEDELIRIFEEGKGLYGDVNSQLNIVS